MTKALIVSYMFPPIAGGGTMRPLKFVKYLPTFGIQPVVFCPQKAAWKAYDYQNLKQPFLKETTIYRCGIKRLQRYYHLRYTKGLSQHPLYYLLALKYFYFLDFFSAWYFECRQLTIEIALREQVECVFTTSPPHSSHLFGHYLKKNLKIPWVMDIRDAMSIDPNRKKTGLIRLQEKFENHYEKKFYANADAIISVSDPIIKSIRQRHANLRLDAKTHTITNGFDSEDFDALTKNGNTENYFTITYTGSFMGKQTPEYFLNAVRLLIETGEIKSSDLKIRFAGYFNDKILSLFDLFSSVFPIEVLKFQPYAETIRLQANSILLLLIVNIDENEGGSQTMTGKFFEYIGAARPIFALVPNGPLKDTIKKGRFGTVAPPKDISKIAGELKHLYAEWKTKGHLQFDPDNEFKKSFSRKQLTGRLAEIFLNIADKNRHRQYNPFLK